MDFEFTEEQKRFRKRVEDFCRREVTDEVLDRLFEKGEMHSDEFYRKMAEEGLLGASWPEEYGGQDLSPMARSIFAEVMGYYEAPLGGYGSTVGLVAQSLVHYGSDEQKREYLPKIARGEIICALGMSEPDAGSDAAAVKTRAVEKDDNFVINGNKFFITSAHLADYILTVTRTNPDVSKYEGISIFFIDTRLPGVTVNPVWTMSNWIVNEVVFEDVKVPSEMMVGEKNRGWYNLVKTFEMERAGLGAIRNTLRLFERLVDYAKETERDGKPLFESETVRRRLAEYATRLEIARLLYYQAAWLQTEGLPMDVKAPYSKLFSSELYHFAAEVGMEILGMYGQVKRGSEYAKIKGAFELLYRHCIASTIGGGTTQIQLNIIARRGLGLK